MKFKIGDHVTLSGPYMWKGKEFSDEGRRVRDLVGTIADYHDEDAYEVQWIEGESSWGCDESCLVASMPAPTDDEVNAAIASIQTAIRKEST